VVPTHICEDDNATRWTPEVRAKAQQGAKAAMAARLGISKQALQNRLKRGWEPERAFSVSHISHGISSKTLRVGVRGGEFVPVRRAASTKLKGQSEDCRGDFGKHKNKK
jgi:DNA-binding transcriptional regulator YdaS (Cro superfamily)